MTMPHAAVTRLVVIEPPDQTGLVLYVEGDSGGPRLTVIEPGDQAGLVLSLSKSQMVIGIPIRLTSCSKTDSSADGTPW
jgi:hypothetical protein